MTRLQQFDHDYYIRLKHIDPKKALEYKLSFRQVDEEEREIATVSTKTTIKVEDPETKTVEEVDVSLPKEDLTEKEIVEKNLQILKEAQEIKKEKINYSVKELKAMLKARGVKRTNFMKPEEVMAKVKEMGL